MRWYMAVLLIGGVVALNVGVFFWNKQRETSSAETASIDVAPAVPASFSRGSSRSVFASGTIEGAGRESQLRFELPGRLVAMEVKEGDRVKAGQVLARLDAAAWEAQLAEAEASLAVAVAEKERLLNGERAETREVARAMVRAAEARAEQSQKEFQRSIPLVRSKSLAQQELDDLESKQSADLAELDAAKARLAEIEAEARVDEVKTADARIAVAQARVNQAKVALAKTTIRAPTDGLILRTLGELGEMILLEQQEPIVTMVGVDAMHVRAYVEELDAFRVALDTRAIVVADGLPDLEFPGTVVFCAPYMTPKKVFSNRPGERVDVKVREVLVRLDPQSALVVGLPVDVRFTDQAVESTSSESEAVSPPPPVASGR